MERYKARRRAFRVVLIFAFILPVLVTARAAPHETVGLVSTEVRAPADIVLLAQENLTVLGQVYPSAGKSLLLALLPPQQITKLQSLGFRLTQLDADSRDAAYYLLSGRRPGALEAAAKRRAGSQFALLWLDERQAVARLAPLQAEAYAREGLDLLRLIPHRLPLTRQGEAARLAEISPNLIIQAMINQVSAADVSNTTGGLSGEWPVTIGGSPYTIATRYTRAALPIEKATQYAFERLAALGLDVVYQPYNLSNFDIRRNVIAEQPGLTQPEKIFMITAHLDDTSFGSPYSLAPGADDNASGSTAVLLAARILSQYDFNCTLRYALFTGEEQGLYGSYAYALAASAIQEDIQGVLNMDMIAYNSDSAPLIELHTRPENSADLAIADLFAGVVEAYGLALTPEILPDGMQHSDHASFWMFGFSAILAIEDEEDFTPYYHSGQDTLSTLDLPFFTNFVKAAVGTIAHMGCLQSSPGYLAGEVADAGTGAPISGASILAGSPGNEWQTHSQPDGAYRLGLSPGVVTANFSAPGYVPYLGAGILVTDSITTTLNVGLDRITTRFPRQLFLPVVAGAVP